MRVVVLSDHETLTTQLQQILRRTGFDCPTANCLPLAVDEDQILKLNPGMVVLVLAPDPPRGLTALACLRARSEARVVAVGPAADPRLILDTIRHGASDYVDEKAVETDFHQALQRIQSEMPSQQEAGKVIAVLGPNGGSGSSTLAANLATVLAKSHEKSLLLDLKLENGDLASLLDVKPAHTVADLCRNIAQLDRIMFEGSLVRHASGVHLLASPRNIADVAEVTPAGIHQAIVMGRALYPYVVMDLDHSFRPEQLKALAQADAILLVMRLDFVSLRNCRRTLDYLKGLGIPSERIRLVANRYGQPKELPAPKVEEALEMKIAHYLPEDAKYINRANNNGVPVVLEAPSSRFSRSLSQLAVSVNGRPKRS